MKTFKEFINEAKELKSGVKKALDKASIKYKDIQEKKPGEIKIVSGQEDRKGEDFKKYEKSVYKALKDNIDLSGDASVYIV